MGRVRSVTYRKSGQRCRELQGSRCCVAEPSGMILLTPLLLVCVSCNRGSARADNSATLPPPAVTVTKATAQELPRYLDEIGRNAAFESVSVMPQVAGRKITERHHPGRRKSARRAAAFRDRSAALQSATDAAQANLAQAKAALELAKIQFARDQELVRTRAISKQDYDTEEEYGGRERGTGRGRRSCDRDRADPAWTIAIFTRR